MEAALGNAFNNHYSDESAQQSDSDQNSYGSEIERKENASLQKKGAKTMKFSSKIDMDEEESNEYQSDDVKEVDGLHTDEEGVSVDMGDQNEDLKSQDPQAVEERRKKRRIEKLEKRISAL